MEAYNPASGESTRPRPSAGPSDPKPGLGCRPTKLRRFLALLADTEGLDRGGEDGVHDGVRAGTALRPLGEPLHDTATGAPDPTLVAHARWNNLDGALLDNLDALDAHFCAWDNRL